MTNEKKDTNNVALIDTLTSLRFIAAFLVFIWHTHIYPNFFDKYQLGYAGVGFFFILSGFVLTYVYHARLARLSWKGIRKFYVARLAKIYPVHLVTVLVVVLLSWQAFVQQLSVQNATHAMSIILSNILLIQAWIPDPSYYFSLNGVSWSISVEMFFYISFPLILSFVSRHPRGKPIVTLVGLGVAWIFVLMLYAQIVLPLDSWPLYINPMIRVFEFATGVMLGVWFVDYGSVVRDRLKQRATIIEVAATGLLIAAISGIPMLPQSMKFSAFLLPFWSIVIFVFAFGLGAISRLLKHRFLIILGEISFSFYMIHQIILHMFVSLQPHIKTYFVVCLLISLVVSWVMYTLVEEPARKSIRAKLSYRS